MLEQIEKLAILGTGLLGSSIGLALKDRGYKGRIVGTSRTRDTAEMSMQMQAIDEVADNVSLAVAGANMIIVAVPLGAFESAFRAIADAKAGYAIVTDVGSTKQTVVRSAREILPDPTRFVGSHPMAGREQQGPRAAKSDLFQGKPCIITPEADSHEGAVKAVEELWQGVGSRLIRMTAEQHDRDAAVISHLPHAAAVMLIRVASKLGGWDLASTGFRDTTRLASSNPPMRADIMTANKEALIHAMDALREELDAVETMLKADNNIAVLQWLREAAETRDGWLGR